MAKVLHKGCVIIDGPAVEHDPAPMRGWFCSDEASTPLPGAWGRYRHQVSGAVEGRMLREKLVLGPWMLQGCSWGGRFCQGRMPFTLFALRQGLLSRD